jgi:hypothetical protein
LGQEEANSAFSGEFAKLLSRSVAQPLKFQWEGGDMADGDLFPGGH